jgi:hypothetical protein
MKKNITFAIILDILSYLSLLAFFVIFLVAVITEETINSPFTIELAVRYLIYFVFLKSFASILYRLGEIELNTRKIEKEKEKEFFDE